MHRWARLLPLHGSNDVCMQVDSLFRINHTDPWVRGDPYRTSRTINFQNTRSSGNAIHGKAHDDAERGAGAVEDSGPETNVIVGRLMAGLEYARPLATGAQLLLRFVALAHDMHRMQRRQCLNWGVLGPTACRVVRDAGRQLAESKVSG